jgi:hypothetical protein
MLQLYVDLHSDFYATYNILWKQVFSFHFIMTRDDKPLGLLLVCNNVQGTVNTLIL